MTFFQILSSSREAARRWLNSHRPSTRSIEPAEGLTLATFDLAHARRITFREARQQMESSAAKIEVKTQAKRPLPTAQSANHTSQRAQKGPTMSTKKTKDTIVRVLETAIEVFGVVIMILPFFQSKGRRKSK